MSLLILAVLWMEIQFSHSVVSDSLGLRGPCSTPGLPVHHQYSRSLLKLMSIKPVMPSNHLILCHPLLLPSIFPIIRVFSNEQSVLLIRWPKDWSFSFSISPSNEYSAFTSCSTDWFDCLAVQQTLKHCNSKVINSSAHSLLYDPVLTSCMTTGTTTNLHFPVSLALGNHHSVLFL